MAARYNTAPAVLTAGQVAAYRERGYLFPVRILDEADSRGYRGKLEAYEAELGHPVQGPPRTKPHLLFRWVDELMRNDAILDCVEDLIGPDILCWNMTKWDFFYFIFNSINYLRCFSSSNRKQVGSI